MPWQLSTLLYVLLASIRGVQNRRIGLYKTDLSLYALAASFTSIFFVGIVVAIFRWSSVDHSAAMHVLPLLFIGGLMFASLNVLLLKLYRFMPASIMAFTTLFNTLSIVLLATIVGGESLTVRQLFGAVLLFAAVVVVGLLSKNTKKTDNKIIVGIGLSLVAALILGPAIMNEKYLIQTIGLNTYVLYGWGIQTLFAFILAFIFRNRNKNTQKITKEMHMNVWAVGLLLGLAGFSYVASINKSGAVSPIALSGTAIVGLTVFMAYFVLHEKDHLQAKIVGLCLSGIGLFLLFS